MKKLLGILVLGLLFTSSALSKKAEHPKLPKDVAWGDKYFKSLISDDYNKKYGGICYQESGKGTKVQGMCDLSNIKEHKVWVVI